MSLVYTALVTPFNSDGSLDLPTFEKNIDVQLEAGVHGLVVCGSTGEGMTIADDEKETLLKTVTPSESYNFTVASPSRSAESQYPFTIKGTGKLKDKYFARREDRLTVYEVTKSSVEPLERPSTAYRNVKIATLNRFNAKPLSASRALITSLNAIFTL